MIQCLPPDVNEPSVTPGGFCGQVLPIGNSLLTTGVRGVTPVQLLVASALQATPQAPASGLVRRAMLRAGASLPPLVSAVGAEGALPPAFFRRSRGTLRFGSGRGRRRAFGFELTLFRRFLEIASEARERHEKILVFTQFRPLVKAIDLELN